MTTTPLPRPSIRGPCPVARGRSPNRATPRPPRVLVEAAVLVGAICILPFFPASAQESANFTVRRLSITVVAETSTSPSYRNTTTAAPVIGSTGVCPSGMASTLGFWSLFGPRDVPTVLALRKSGEDPVLMWSGQADEFTVYRSSSPHDLMIPPNVLLTTPSCEATDTTARANDLEFYAVGPTP
jgi:hypothetical protein